MRQQRHTMRPGARRGVGVAVSLVLALVASILTISPAQALNDTGTGGVFMPATGRILDTKNNVGGYSTPMPAKTWRTVTVAGKAGLPDDGTVGAVSVVATVADISGQGQLFGRPDDATKQTLMGIYGGENKQNTSFSSVLAVAADGTIQVYAETTARLILDVQGYYTSNDDGTAPGGFVPLNGKRVADSRYGDGIPKAQLTSGKSATLQVTGTAGVPAGASAVIVNLIAMNATSATGYLTPYPTGGARPTNSFNYAGSVTTTMQAQVQLSADGKITIYNSSSTADLAIDVQGYFTAAGKGGAVFTPGAGRILDTRSTGNTALAGNETRAIDVAGKAGVPVMGSGINSVVLTLTSLATNGAGWGRVWANGTTEPDTASLRYDDGTIRTNTITVPLGANGKINLKNIGAGATNFVIDVQGWYADPASPMVNCDNGATAGSWGVAQQSVDDPVTCTVSAPAATASDQFLEVTANGMPIGEALLSPSATTQLVVELPALSGAVNVRAAVSDANSELSSTEYAFGLGDWTTSKLVPTIADGNVVDPSVALGAISADVADLPTDSIYQLSVTDTTTNVALTTGAWSEEGISINTVSLERGHDYSWSARIKAKSSWQSTSTVSTPTWHFRVANEGEPTTPDPVDDSFTSPTAPTTAAAKETVNGCTLSPERWYKAVFTPVCNAHDRCYFSTSTKSRKACDEAFGQGLRYTCALAYGAGAKREACYVVAGIYRQTVRLVGRGYYKGKGDPR